MLLTVFLVFVSEFNWWIWWKFWWRWGKNIIKKFQSQCH